MVNFFCRQERSFGLGNFINCTPALKALSDYYKEPIPVLFESIGEGFEDCQFIRHIEKPEGYELFGSYTVNSNIPDWLFIYNEVQSKLGIKLGSIPDSYVDKTEYGSSRSYCVILRGCFSNIPHKVAAKDPGDDIYIEIIRYLHTHSTLKTVFVGTEDDYIRAKTMFDFMGLSLEWNETTLREALSIVNNSKFVIGNDTGLMHAAAALQKPAFCMWVKTNFPKNKAKISGGGMTYSMRDHFPNLKRWINEFI